MEKTFGRKVQDWFFGGVIGCFIVLVILALVFVVFGLLILLFLG